MFRRLVIKRNCLTVQSKQPSVLYQTFNRYLNYNVNQNSTQLSARFNQKPNLNQLQHRQHQLKSSFNNLTKFIPFVNSNQITSNAQLTSGLFGKSQLRTCHGFDTLRQQAEQRVTSLINEALNHTYDESNERKLVEIFDDISNELCCVADLAEFVRTTHPSMDYREAANTTFSHISQLVETLNTNQRLYTKLSESLKHNEQMNGKLKMDECDKRVCKLFLIDFEQSGIHLDETIRNQFVQTNNKLVDVLTKFQAESQTASKVSVANVHPRFKNMVKYYSDPIVVESMFINSEDELMREFVYKTYLQRNDLQETYFRNVLAKRRKLANLCAFETFAHRANQSMMMENPENVVEFLNKCSKSIWTKAENEFNKMRDFKRKYLNSPMPLMQWDVPLVTNKIKRQMFDIDKSQYMSYLSLGSCIEGLNMIVNHLYNVKLEVSNASQGELWHEDIYKLAVIDNKTNQLLGFIYCDFYQREEKFANVDCHFTIQCSKQLSDGSFQLPIVVLHLNFPPPLPNRPTLLTFEMMENLFHEFGHAMHSMLAKTRYQHVSGTRCSTDFAEVPSQLMEYYCRDPRILKLFAKHYESQEPMDDRLIHKLCESKKLFAATEMQSQLLNSILDQAFHLIDFERDQLAPSQIVEKYTNEYHSLPFVADTYWHLRYTHLVGYGAKYYSYLISKAIAAKIWNECFERDPLSSSAGENYRKKMLEFGGERKPHELIDSLIGFHINTDSLVKSLTENL